MSIFAKPLSQLEPADLQHLMDEGAVENVRLEFKREVPDKEETLKKVSSLANTYGGFVVVGASAKSSDGRIDGLPGVDAQSGYKQKIVDWCFGGANPPLSVEVSDPISVPAGGGKVCYVISVGESDVAPHFLNGRKGIWIRTNEFSARFEARLANEDELRYLFGRRKLIGERRDNLLNRAREGFDTYIASKTTDVGGRRGKSGSILEFSVGPRFRARQLCEEASLKSFIRKTGTPWRGMTFPYHGSPAISQHESVIVLDAGRDTSFFEVTIWGMLFYGAQIEGKVNEQTGIHLYQFLGYLLVFIRHASKMLQELGYAAPLTVDVRISSIRGVKWFHPAARGQWLESVQGSELDDKVQLSVATSAESLRERPDELAAELLRYVFHSVNWPQAVADSDSVQTLIRKGYEYNSWPSS